MQPRPFTVIGGFLGAGKTTLVNRILREAGGVRYAVMVNDFGAINVDADLIAAHDGKTMTLANGCICCSQADGFVSAMLRLMQAPEEFDHVVLEASGVAEPDRIMDFARLDPGLAPDATIVLADAAELRARLADPHVGDIVGRQIAAADILLLNKTDRATAGERAAVEDKLRRLNSAAPILPCRHAKLPLDGLLGTGLGEPAAARGAKSPAHGAFFTAAFRAEAPIGRADFEAFAAALPRHVLRGKGLVVFAESRDTRHAWQRVGAGATLAPHGPAETPESGLVLIGTAPLDAVDPQGLFVRV